MCICVCMCVCLSVSECMDTRVCLCVYICSVTMEKKDFKLKKKFKDAPKYVYSSLILVCMGNILTLSCHLVSYSSTKCGKNLSGHAGKFFNQFCSYLPWLLTPFASAILYQY